MAINIFLSCFRINTPLRDSLTWQLLLFYVVRFVLLPIILWYVCNEIAPDYALGLLLFALCPAGASSAALTGLYNGNVTLAFVLTILSSLGSVLLIPVVISALNHAHITLSPYALLQALALSILFPGCLYMLLRRRKFFIDYSNDYGRLTMVVLISLITFLVLSKKRDYFLAHPQGLFVPLLVGAGFYVIAVVVGFAVKAKPKDRIAYGVCSAFNNTMFGIGLALLYFDETTILIMISTEIIWAFLPMLVQPIIKRLSPRKIKEQTVTV